MVTTSWEELVGSSVEGWPLRSLVGSADQSGVYATTHDGENAVIKLKAADGPAPRVPQLAHPHIIRLFANGVCEIGGTRFHYFVMEAAEENLGSVIQARALSAEETREMLAPVLETLHSLHEQQLAHGAVKPANILAKGDSVKLSPDTIRPAASPAASADDMRELGLTVIEVLSQKRQPWGITKVPQPFLDIVEQCLQPDPAQRWTARQAAERLKGAAASRPAELFQTPAEPRKRIPAWAYLVGLVCAGGVLMLTRTKETPPPPPPPVQATIPKPVVVVPAPAPEKPSAFSGRSASPPASANPAPKAPVVPKTAPKSEPPAAPVATGSVKGAQGWFVVVASYAKESDAAQQAQSLNHRFPHFKASVFPPSPIDTHYIVIIGSGLSEQAADALRQRAVASGLPGDAYIKRFPAPR